MNKKEKNLVVQTLADSEEWCKKFQVNVYFLPNSVAVAKTVNIHTKLATGYSLVDAVNSWITQYGSLLTE